ncbi:MAG: starvation-inducible DNA-binding protein [Pseudonocardiales bacterium]|nr:starvation-inducible DNA-binding protein [Pseudonocardiales bacterium]
MTATVSKANSRSNRHADGDTQQFVASPAFAQCLQRVLVDLVELHLQGKQAHWNLVGHNFRDLHLQLDEIVDIAREGADTIAERMRALAVSPDGRSDTVAASTSLPMFPAGGYDTRLVAGLITSRLREAVTTMREVHGAVDAEDPTTSDLLHALIAALEKQAWMLSAEIAVASQL